MSPRRYKTLLTYLPSMACAVNSFESPQVQAAVYGVLMEALEVRLQAEGVGRTISTKTPSAISSSLSDDELTHDLIEGDSIHTDHSHTDARASVTVL